MIIISSFVHLLTFSGNSTNTKLSWSNVELWKLLDFTTFIKLNDWKANYLKNWWCFWIVNVVVAPASLKKYKLKFVPQYLPPHPSSYVWLLLKILFLEKLDKKLTISTFFSIKSSPIMSLLGRQTVSTYFVILAASVNSINAISCLIDVSLYSLGRIILNGKITCGSSAQCWASQSMMDFRSCSPSLTVALWTNLQIMSVILQLLWHKRLKAHTLSFCFNPAMQWAAVITNFGWINAAPHS